MTVCYSVKIRDQKERTLQKRVQKEGQAGSFLEVDKAFSGSIKS